MLLKPEETMQALLLRDDSRVADFGAGSGIFTFAAARRIQSGKVYAVDIQRELLSRIAGNFLSAENKNIEVIWGDIEEPEGSKIAESFLDAVILANVLFQTKNKRSVISEAGRVLKNGGKALLVDWDGEFGGLGPREEDIVSRASALSLFEEAGFTFLQEAPSGDHHYGAIFLRHKP